MIIPVILLFLFGVGGYLYKRSLKPVDKRVVQKNEAFYVSGNVLLKRHGEVGWSGLERDASLEDGDIITTSENSSVEIKFGKDMKNIISAREDTTIKLDAITEGGDKKITLENGKFFADLEALDSGSRFEVRTPTAVCGVLGTGFEAVVNQGSTFVKVYDGLVHVKSAGMRGLISKPVIVRQGSQTVIRKHGAPEQPVPLAEKDMQKWHNWKGDITQHMFRTFYVYTDEDSPENHYTPSGWLGDYDAIRRITWDINPHSGKDCQRFRYTGRTPQGAGWAGVYWQNPVNNWGNVKGGFNLNGAKKLTFWVRGEKGDERIVHFGMGGISGQYPDSCKAEIGPILLTTEWKEYSIDLAGKDLSYISGGFYWMTDRISNPDGATIYLDDIAYE
jgi:hypothetical protein